MAAVGSLPDDTADFGDYVKNYDEETDLEVLVEPWQKYDIKKTQDVFYPVCLGEVLNERYLIEHKLGFGGGSTVWIAHDLQGKKDVALKVMALGEWSDNETRMQDEIIENVKDTSHPVTYLGTFLVPGNQCYHRVLVFPLIGPCLSPLMLNKSKMSMATHLNERNCMWGMAPLSHDRSAKYEALGRPIVQIISWVDLWKQGELVGPVEIPENLRTDEFYLGDFALAKKLGDPITQRGRPPSQFCSPDRLHGKEPSFACDMWSYMIIFAVLYLGFSPFHSAFKGGIISSITQSIGPLPKEWKGLMMEPLIIVEQQLMHTMMSKVLTYNLEERLTATQLLRDPSFRAIMDKYGC
ncbi:hypothetical protein PENPOL_c014G08236 [Penicillium polonicum]|uniref:Protein kinase domain-containing protein n=1 Tax=Penicillium polonicum TaxID=60169 RepID=A0A1V6NB86_PENPO|nr:hypothetical protein PENPOL_c014G08236 [Penicillium polonicum]